MPHDEAAAVLPREPNDLEKLLMMAKRYVAAFVDNDKNHPTAREAAFKLCEQIDRALTAGPRGGFVGTERDALAALVHDFYRNEIGTLMHQAEHWAMPEHEHPKAVMLRIFKADELFQVATMFDPIRQTRGWKEPWEEMERTMATPFYKTQPRGAYPPSVDLHRYRNPRFVVERLDALRKEGKDRG